MTSVASLLIASGIVACMAVAASNLPDQCRALAIVIAAAGIGLNIIAIRRQYIADGWEWP